MAVKNLILVEDIPEGIVTKTANEIISIIQTQGRDIDTTESEHIKLRLLHYSKKRGIELLLKDYHSYGLTKTELSDIYDRMEIERLNYLLDKKVRDVVELEVKRKTEREKLLKRKSLNKIKNLVDLYGPIKQKV